MMFSGSGILFWNTLYTGITR